ncbi:Carbonic anhydrase like protein [Verticillium longisporum]|nr:Carbonic anhydrase like protein [Verticillium longisporum]
MKSFFALATLATLAAAICDHGTTFFPRSVDEVHVADFGFNELDGPLNWHALAPGNINCAKGKNQSPINLASSDWKTVAGSSLGFNINTVPNTGAKFLNLGSTVEVVANGTLVRSGKTYNLVQFHFHTPSEHRVDSEHYPMEVHFVFQAADASLSVVGFLIEVGNASQALKLWPNVFKNLNDIRDPGTLTKTGPLSFNELKNHLAKSAVFQYSGSLTTPPCTQNIAWNVVKQPVYIDLANYIKAKSVMKFNSRITQNFPGEINLIENACNSL